MPLPPCEGTQKEGNHGSVVKDLTAMQEMQEMQFRSLNWEDPLEKKMATYSSILCLENPMDGGAWCSTVHGVTENWTLLSD